MTLILFTRVYSRQQNKNLITLIQYHIHTVIWYIFITSYQECKLILKHWYYRCSVLSVHMMFFLQIINLGLSGGVKALHMTHSGEPGWTLYVPTEVNHSFPQCFYAAENNKIQFYML